MAKFLAVLESTDRYDTGQMIMIAVSILEIGERLCFFVWQQAAKQKTQEWQKRLRLHERSECDLWSERLCNRRTEVAVPSSDYRALFFLR